MRLPKPMRVVCLVVAPALLGGCAATKGTSSRAHVELEEPSERARRHADMALGDAELAVARKDAAGAKDALARAKSALAEPALAASPEREHLEQRFASLQSRLSHADEPTSDDDAQAATATPAEPAPATAEARAASVKALQESIARMSEARAGLHGHELDEDDVASAEQARGALAQAVHDAKNRTKDDAEVARLSKAGADLLADVAEDIRLAHLIADFVAGPGAAGRKGFALSHEAAETKDSKKRHAALLAARDAFQECAEGSQKMLADAPVLSRTALFIATSRTSPAKIQAVCTRQRKDVEKKLASR